MNEYVIYFTKHTPQEDFIEANTAEEAIDKVKKSAEILGYNITIEKAEKLWSYED